MSTTRHLLGISGGKDSAALAIYMKMKYPEIEMEYYTSDTGRELKETYQLIDNLEVFLGKKIVRLAAVEDSPELPFDHFLKMYGGFLPSSNARWCTKKLKLDPFEKFVNNDPVISYVGIRGDEAREGYISRKQNIQSIFPFRSNIWSEDVISKALSNENINFLINQCEQVIETDEKRLRFQSILSTPLSNQYSQAQKLNGLMNCGIKEFNLLIFSFLKTTDYPLSSEETYQLLENEDNLIRSDIFKILETSGVGVPEYYKAVSFEVNGRQAVYSRSRSGCFFCFYQQKIEWVWLYEQHPNLYEEAMRYEKGGYTWMQDESLASLIEPERIVRIKEDYIKRTERTQKSKSPFLLDILSDAEGEGCASCFI